MTSEEQFTEFFTCKTNVAQQDPVSGRAHFHDFCCHFLDLMKKRIEAFSNGLRFGRKDVVLDAEVTAVKASAQRVLDCIPQGKPIPDVLNRARANPLDPEIQIFFTDLALYWARAPHPH